VVSEKEHSDPKGVKPKMRDCKLGSGVNSQGALNHKGVIRPGLFNL